MSQAQHNVSPTSAPRSRNRQTISRAYAGRVLLTAGLVALIGVLLFLAWQVAEVLLLGFAGLLLAVLLRGLADRVSTHTPIKGGWALGLVLLVLATLIWALAAVYPHLKWVALANMPYLFWVSFATILQLTITYLNY